MLFDLDTPDPEPTPPRQRRRYASTVPAAAILNRYVPIVASHKDPNVCLRGHPRATYWVTTTRKDGRVTGRCNLCARQQERIRYLYTYRPKAVAAMLTREAELAKLGEEQQKDQIWGHRVRGARLTPRDTGEERPKW